MVVIHLPSTAKKRSRVKQRPRSRSKLVVAAITSIAVVILWLISSSLLHRSTDTDSSSSGVRGKQTISSGAPEVRTISVDVVDFDEEHLSAKNMLGTQRPYFLYGTAWKKDKTADLVYQAVSSGFRFIDTACQPKHYDEPGVGYGWKMAADELKLSREDIFLQTKFTAVGGQDPSNIPYDRTTNLEDQVRQSVHASLRNLKTDYIDSLVLHSPMQGMAETMKVWKVFESLVQDGKVRQLGISNCYDMRKFQELYKKAKIKPKVLQNRFYVDSNFDVQLRTFCKSVGVQYQSFWTLTANLKALNSPDWKAMANAKGLTPQTLMYAYIMTMGHTPLSGTKNAEHMKQDVDLMLRFQRGETILRDRKSVV